MENLRQILLRDAAPEVARTRDFAVDFKVRAMEEGDKEEGIIQGYASVYGNVDSYGTVFARGCFKESLKNRPAHDVKFLWQHDRNRPAGVLRHLFEDAFGLGFEARLALKTQTGMEAYELVQMKAVSGVSVGFNVVREEYTNEGTINFLELRLNEISIVTFPANPLAEIKSCREAQRSVREWENFLREAMGLTIREAKVAAGAATKALTELRDAGEKKAKPEIRQSVFTPDVLDSLKSIETQIQSVSTGG